MDPISQTEPVPEPVVEPAVEVAPEPVVEPVVEPAVEVAPEPVSVLEKVEESEVPPQDKVTHLYIPMVTTLPKPARPVKKGMRFL